MSRPRYFPPPHSAGSDGFLGVGGLLNPQWLLDAYRHGIFPWPIFEDPELTAWWSPEPRAIFEFDEFHASRRLMRTFRSGKFQVTCDQAFSKVIHGCATASGREGNTWLTPHLARAYERMFERHFPQLANVPHAADLPDRHAGAAVAECAVRWARELMVPLVKSGWLTVLSTRQCLSLVSLGTSRLPALNERLAAAVEDAVFTCHRLYLLEHRLRDAGFAFSWNAL